MSPSDELELGRERSGPRLRIAVALALGIGGLMTVALVLVLVLSALSASRSTLSLLRQHSEAVLALLEARLEQRLLPAASMLQSVGDTLEAGELPLGDDDAVGRYLVGALAAAPDVERLVFIHAPTTMVVAERAGTVGQHYAVDFSELPFMDEVLRGSREHEGVYWGDVVRPGAAAVPVMNARRAVRVGGVYVGLLAAAVRVDRLSALLSQAGQGLGQVFVLYDGTRVLAHPRFAVAVPQPRSGNALPEATEIDDPVLAAYVATDGAARRRTFENETGIRLVETGDGEFAVVGRRIDSFGARPLTVGVYYPAATAVAELRRLAGSAGAGFAVLLVALGLALAFARFLSRPILRLAAAASLVQQLAIERVQRLPPSVFRELSDAADAFNHMVNALRWFETYVPKSLAHRLVRQGNTDLAAAPVASASVLFTDIVGFTGLTEDLPAAATAAFLNEHFARIGAAVEAEGGTIDKYIGDSLMAFWGAPDAHPDDAARACRAALAIRAALAADNRERAADGRLPVRLRIGVHTGEAIVGNIGAPGRVNYTIVGDTVNIANRLEQLGREMDDGTPDATIVISGETLLAAHPFGIEARHLGARHLRGRQHDIVVYAL